ncbi:unnamed protein product (macronuclear) [Paramecium tetraurelia]|uniref:Transmembrane protein n=1 Tax=Paramecium tetraurelia TaxID=5888 RepID=A0EGF3_PARTE|nr:uncharacterized protein GSPATT00026718001 [Paramecium tetraurelia]CAK94394.1 unnamed protein product [Paramecium tetraurelia]|eukprot:XP_001461767.1 hypothetical protein (macronuclear) [Paramecium tetraurelia strain d4-2]
MYIILILLQFVKSKEIINLEIDKSYKYYGEVPNSWLHYPVYHYKLEVPQDREVFVFLATLNDARPQYQLYMSQKEIKQVFIQYLRQVHNAQECKFENLIVCQIKSQQHISKITYYFVVLCLFNCHYELKIMTMNTFVEGVMIMKQEKEKPFKLNLANIQYDRLCLKLIHFLKFISFNIYINMNETIPTTSEFDIEQLFLKEGLVCLQRNYTYPQSVMTAFINQEGYFLILLNPFQKFHEISLNQQWNDQILRGNVNYYKLIIKDFKEHMLMFYVNCKTHSVFIYVQPCIEDRCKRDYLDFDWQYQFDKEQYNYYTIPTYKMIYTEVYLISINTKDEMVEYELEVKISDNPRQMLIHSKVNAGVLEKNQVALYLFKSIDQLEIVNTRVIANFPKGHGVLLSKQCFKDSEEMAIIDDIQEYLQKADPDNYYNCSITPDQASSFPSDDLQISNFVGIQYDTTAGNKNVTQFWFEKISFNFVYVLAIYSYVDFMRFSLTTQQVINNPILQFDKFTINYKYIKQQTNDHYQIQTFSLKKPDLQNYFVFAAYEGESNIIFVIANTIKSIHYETKLTTSEIEFISLDEEVGHSYTIQIQATTNLKYSVIEILKSTVTPEIKYIPLHFGVQFKTIDLDLYFSLEITENANFYINLKSLWVITSQGANLPMNLIQPQQAFSKLQLLKIQNSFITCMLKLPLVKQVNHIKQCIINRVPFLQLFLGDTFYGLLEDQKTLYFFYQSIQNSKQIQIIVTYQSEYNNNNNLQIYISSINKYPDQFNYEYLIKPNSNHITIPNIIYDSILQIGVYSRGSNKYTLLIQDSDSAILLKDNIVQTRPIQNQQHFYFYYLIPKNIINPIKIQAITKFNLIELLCNIVDYDSNNIEKENYPTFSKHDIKELFSASPSNKLLFINETNLMKCQNQGCILLINAYVLGHFDYFNVMVSSKYTVIRNLEMIIGYASQNSMSYYYFEISEVIMDIQITVRALQECKCDIYVQKSKGQDNILYPSIDKYTYKFTSDTLTISEKDNIGQYMIGVTSQNCIFEIMLHLGGFQLHYIHNGQFVETSINDNVQYYYLNTHQEPFRIMIYNMRNIIASIRIENNNETMELANNSDLFGGIMQIDKDVCQSCTYILSLHPIRPTALSILLIYNKIPFSIPYGRIYYDQCLTTCEFELTPGELNLFVYSKSITLTFNFKIKRFIKMDLTYSNHLIPINETCILQIGKDAYYSINLSNRENPIILQLGRVFNSKNTISRNQSLFNFKIDRIDQEYVIQVSSQSDVIIEVIFNDEQQNKLKIIPKSELIFNQSKKKFIYQFQQIEQPYQITLQCSDNYYILVDAYNAKNKFKYINFNNHYIEIIMETQQYNIQATYEQEMQFEKFDCLGKTQLQKLSQGNQRETYFKIQVIERSDPYPFNIVSLVPHLQYSHDQWHQKNTRFEIIKLSNDYLEVTVNAMKRKKTGSMNLNKLIYIMHFSNQENYMRPLGCEIDIEFLGRYTNDSSIFYNTSILEVKEKQEAIQFIVLINREIIYGQLVFKAFYEGYDIPYTYFYNVALIYNETNDMKMKMKEEVKIEEIKIDYILIVIGISLAVGIGLILLWIYIPKQKQKRKKLNEEQQYELSQLKQGDQVNTT